MSRQSGPGRVLIVDGYNVLNARRRITSAASLADAREALINELQDYAGYSGQRIVVVFDAWQADRQVRSVEQHGPVRVVYTQKGETADHYIERLCDEYAQDIEYRKIEVRVATSDGLEQTIVLGRGATRLSSRELLLEMEQVRARGVSSVPREIRRSTVGDRIPAHIIEKMREMTREKEPSFQDGSEERPEVFHGKS